MGSVTAVDYPPMSRKVKDALREKFGPEIVIRTEEGEFGKVFVILASPYFDGKSETERQTEIWDYLRASLKEDAQAVALVLPLSSDQI
jgi:acid stress-induced BolA-like protein IbaG/YrbA